MEWSSNGSTPQYQQNGAVGQQYHQPPPLQQHPLAAQAAAAPVRESIHTVHTVQRNDGVEDMYLVSLEDGGKRVRRSHTDLQQSAPGLLAAYLSEPSPSLASLNDTSSDLDRPSRRATTGGKTVAALSSSRQDVAARARQAKRQRGDDDDDVESLSDGQSERSYDDDGQDETEEEQSSGSDFQDDEGASASKSKGRKKSKAKSPKKGARRSTRETRHVKAFGHLEYQDSGADYSDAPSTASGARKSTRDNRKKSRYAEGSDDDYSAPVSEAGMPNRSSRAKARQSYGEQEFEYEDDQDDEEPFDASQWDLDARPIDQHRQFCTKCEQNAVPFLLENIRQRREKNKGRKRKKKVDADLDEDTDQEEDRVTQLGAWFECGVCVQSYHFGCLPGQLRKEYSDNLKAEHLAAHNAMYPPPPPSTELIQIEETGEWVLPPPPISPVPLPVREKVEWNNKRRFSIPKCWGCKKVGARRCFVCHVSGKKVEHFVPESQREAAGQDEAQPQPQPQAPAALPAPQQPTQAMDSNASAASISAFPSVLAPYPDNGAPIPFGGDALALAPVPAPIPAPAPADVAAPVDAPAPVEDNSPGLMFRCTKCKRPAHYSCLDEAATTFDEHIIAYFTDGTCHECYRWQANLDVILAWADDDDNTVEIPDDDDMPEEVVKVKKKDAATGKVFYIPSAKDPMAKAKYLVKWQGFGYRQLAWVPHAFLVAAYPAKLSNFLAKGSPIAFEVAPVGDEAEDGEEEARVPVSSAPLPDPTAEERIPKSWKTPERVLNVWYQSKAGPQRDAVVWANYRGLPEDPEESMKLVVECFFKWGDLPYGASSIEAPLQPGEEGYEDYVKAYKAFIEANSARMRVPVLPPKQLAELDRPRAENKFVPIREQPSYLVGGKLMPFQVDGVNFLFYQWWKRTGCILADEMGLGKTVQIITLLSVLSNEQGARPFLVTVPNSTIGNWVREFERWAPSMRVVPYSGDADSRRIIEDYELFDMKGALKTHVVLATYEALEKNINVFRAVQRWDCLVVDEGQRLKSGPGGHLWDALQSLNINHRVLLSGTPLNNNLTELFNLLNFIDPGKWEDQEALTERYAELTPEKVEEVRGILKPYFLRRTKDLVLNLPPLTEIVVPVSMSPLQRQIYRGILERNASAIESIFQKAAGPGAGTKKRKTNFNNVLMELRKTLCHPYIISPEIEPRGVSPEQEHANLTEASAKFSLLATMLPKLHKAGHRVLIFSQFKLTLNIIESFLAGLRLKFLRLDGDTKQLDRQRGIDDFNAPDSDYFCYLLSTRAGGVGINLTTADTVIMYDQDFNPHQDIQAIARAHRIGQKKPVRVFKLLVKGTCEEKIFNAGNKKLGLDHLIIQRIDAKDESEDVEGILQYGAKAIFDDKEAEANAIHYSEQDVETLLARSAEPIAEADQAAGGAAFAHAKIWEKSGTLADVVVPEEDDNEAGENLHGFWAGILDKQEEEERNRKAAEAFNIGRGKRSRAQVAYKTDSPAKKKKKRNDDEPEEFGDSSGDDFMDVEKPANSEEDSGSDFELDADDKPERVRKPRVPELARLDESAPKSSRKGRSSFSDPIITVPNKAARDKRRREIIKTLALAAARFQDDDLNATLERAMSDQCKRLEQTILVDDAAKRITALAQPYIAAGTIRAPTPPPPPKQKGKKAAKEGEEGKRTRAPKGSKSKTASAVPSAGPSTVASDSNASTPAAAEVPDRDPSTISSLPVLHSDRPTSAKDLKSKARPDFDELKADVQREKLVQGKLTFTLGGAKPREASMDLE